MHRVAAAFIFPSVSLLLSFFLISGEALKFLQRISVKQSDKIFIPFYSLVMQHRF
jgi:hypothetical protein